jgi:protein phosphatase-4 regulatory subunit 3
MVKSEDASAGLLHVKVHLEDIYQRQQDTIISWNEPGTSLDYALSFQEADGCTELWEQICSLQGRPADEGGREIESLTAASTNGPMGDTHLPAVEMRNLAAISELLCDAPLFRRGRLAEVLQQDEYIPQLVALFSQVEDVAEQDDLHHMFGIFRGLMMLNNPSIYEILLRDDLLMGVVGALEHDPEMRSHQARHRQFLRERAQFKLVVPFEDSAVLQKVHQNFHLSFIKDVVLPRALDDNAFAAINQLQFFNNVHIISSLSNDNPFLTGLRQKLGWGVGELVPSDGTASRSSSGLRSGLTSPIRCGGADRLEGGTRARTGREPQLEALRLLQELCTITKQLQLYHRAAFYRRFVEHGYFVPLAPALLHFDSASRQAAIDILLSSTQHDPSLLRQHVLQEKPASEMMGALLRLLTVRESSGEKSQVGEVLRCLLDPDGMEGREQDDFLNLFYEQYVHELAAPVAGVVSAGTGPMGITASTAVRGAAGGAVAGQIHGSSESASSEGFTAEAEEDEGFDVLSARQHACELLCFCVIKHSYRIKYFILRNNVLFKVLRLALHHDKCLVLAALRFFRTCIGLKDEFYNRCELASYCAPSTRQSPTPPRTHPSFVFPRAPADC